MKTKNRRQSVSVIGLALWLLVACSSDDPAETESVSPTTTQATAAETTVPTIEAAVEDGPDPTVTTAPAVDTTVSEGEETDATAPTEPLVSVGGSAPFAELQILDLRRVGQTVTLDFVIVTDDPVRTNDVADVFAAPEDKFLGGTEDVGSVDDRRRSVSGVTLVDEANQKRHLVLRDSAGVCLCTGFNRDVQADTAYRHSAQFPAPPEDVDEMTVQVPLFPAIDQVPLRVASE